MLGKFMKLRVCCLLTFIIFFASCKHPANEAQGRSAESYVPDAESVAFNIEPVPSGNGLSEWLATYSARGKVAKFRIQFGTAKALEDGESEALHIQSGEGSFVALDGSDASVFLSELRQALQAKTIPAKVHRQANLPFTFVNLGEHQSRASDGGFFTQPPGDWTAIKIFLGQGDKEAQLYLNINPAIRKGEFSMKDSDYGDLAISQLATVL
jgi:hypothetical protein